MITWREIEVAAQLEAVSPVVIALLCQFDDHLRHRIDAVYSTLDALSQRLDMIEETQARMWQGLRAVQDRPLPNTVGEQIEALEAKLAEVRRAMCRANLNY